MPIPTKPSRCGRERLLILFTRERRSPMGTARCELAFRQEQWARRQRMNFTPQRECRSYFDNRFK
jgi:hypothetical protein